MSAIYTHITLVCVIALYYFICRHIHYYIISIRLCKTITARSTVGTYPLLLIVVTAVVVAFFVVVTITVLLKQLHILVFSKIFRALEARFFFFFFPNNKIVDQNRFKSIADKADCYEKLIVVKMSSIVRLDNFQVRIQNADSCNNIHYLQHSFDAP